MDEPETVYTRETANLLLDEVRERLVRLQRAYADVAGHRSSMASSAGGNGGDAGASRWLASSRTAADELSWFRDRGIVVRDIEQGLIDFPGLRGGRQIYLCWRLGEDAVNFWHDRETGFAGRQPLE
ncbi:MAG: hypothetical protein QOG36_2263 [Actinomycetota bacterium]|nr:hypothetical protein [Actinomycetota bacterium]MEA2533160.1 hypothetical protein [Actinomycetota bacterium]MEA2591715.1 hypothetical protein [Actinomycetota bacterium]